MYSVGFIVCYSWMSYFSDFGKKKLDSLLIFVFFGVILGGRLGYILLYDLDYFMKNPTSIVEVWKWGMSFHGGFLWVVVAVYLFSKKYKIHFFRIMDILAIIVPMAIWLGRIGNYINQELLGFTPYDWPFSIMKNNTSYFPSTLLELFLEGGVLFLTMLFFAKTGGFFRKNPRSYSEGILSGIFLIGYSTLRIFAEFFRLPDAHIGYIMGTSWMTLGMLYSVPLWICGVFLVFHKRS